MRRLFVLAVVSLFASACEQAADDTTPVVQEEIKTFSGADAYELACARCHEEGLEGAPRTGDTAAWAGRSWLWEAVLFEHAKKGYNEMPAKGGYEDLDDVLIEKAAEYMLRATHSTPPPAD